MFVGYKVKIKDSAKLLYSNIGIFRENRIGIITKDYGLTRNDRLVQVKFDDETLQDYFFSEIEIV